MIWLNKQGSIQPIGSPTGSANIAGRSWTVWTGNNGGNNVVSYVSSSATSSLNFNVRDFIRDTFSRGSQYGNNSWYLTSIQAGFEPWIGGVGLAVNSFSASVTGGTPPTTRGPVTTRRSPRAARSRRPRSPPAADSRAPAAPRTGRPATGRVASRPR